MRSATTKRTITVLERTLGMLGLLCLLGGGLDRAFAQTAPVLRGGVETSGATPSASDLRWLQQVRSTGRDPEYAAVGECQQLLRNVAQAWQLATDDLDRCDQLRGTRSPQPDVSAAADPCWRLIGQIETDLTHAADNYREADRLRGRPESANYVHQGNNYNQQASAGLQRLVGCVDGVRAAQVGAAQRVAGQVQQSGTSGGATGSTSSGGNGLGNRPTGGGSVAGGSGVGGPTGGSPLTGEADAACRQPGLDVSPDWKPQGPVIGEIQRGACAHIACGNTGRWKVVCPGWPHPPRWADLDGTWFACGNSPEVRPPFCQGAAARAPQPGYWKGVEAGLSNCGQSVAVMMQAFQAMAANDFQKAAELLGITDSASGLRSLWQEWMATQAIDVNGQRVSEFDAGKRQAERVCMYVLLPKAQSCAANGTRCVLQTAGQACTVVMRRVAQLRPRIPFRGRPVPSAIFRGLLLPDENFIKQIAVGEGKVIIVRDSNPWSMRWIGRDGYAPKPLDVKGKTLKPEDLAGLPQAQADRYLGLASAKGLGLEQRNELLQKGYQIAPPGAQEIITGPKGERFYSDTDLHGVYNLDGSPGWSPALLDKLQCHFFDRGVQHGPHDTWPLRNDKVRAGPNYGPQVGNGKALTAYLPDGTSLHIESLAEMKAFYKAIGVNWQAIYPGQ